MIRFGPSGNELAFYERGNKKTEQAAKYIFDMGLTAYEYSFGKGVRVTPEKAQSLKEAFAPYGIAFSVHAPYYINFANPDPEMVQKSFGYLLASAQAAKAMGAKRVVVHSGSCADITRREALNLAKDTLGRALRAADEDGFGEIFICPETMGKINQLGSVDEVMELCSINERLIPTIDFGHVNARSLGGLKTKSDFEQVFDAIKNKLGSWHAENFHAHYSRIEYTNAGEKKHHCFSETEYEPEFEPIAEIIAERRLSPIIICESRGSQTLDAVQMQEIYRRAQNDFEA